MIPAATVTEQEDGKEHPLVGQVIGERYRIDALLGEGGMGAVFRGTHMSLGRPVAVKVLHPRFSHDEHIAKRFDREALAVSKLDHPNCVQVIDFGTTSKGMKYLVMQMLDGKELRDVTGVALPIEQVVYLGIQVLRALEHAHKRGLVHRDLKPENIFLVHDDDDNEVVKLVDFGIVKLLEDVDQEKLTRLGMAFGTPTYMSPEQAAGGKVDARTDLYAVGVVLYELLTGAPPFEADEPGILLRMQILADPPPLPDTVPKAVAAVVNRLLAKEPDERYADAREARRALAAAYKLPSKITGLVGLAAVPVDETTEPPEEPEPSAAQQQEQAQAQAPTVVQAWAAPRAEPTPGGPSEPSPEPEPFARSGGTVLAPPTGHGVVPLPVPSASASASHGASLGPGAAAASFSHGASPMPTPMPGASASFSHGASPMPMPASASFSHGAAPIVHPGHGAPFDPLSVSSPGLPVMGPGLYGSGAHPHSGAYPVAPGARRDAGRRTGTIVVIAVIVVAWVILAIAWWASRDDEPGGPGGPTPAPAAKGIYRFTDEAPATGTPQTGTPVGTPAGAGGSAAEGATAPPPAEAKGQKKPKKIKKPKPGDEDD
jgi:serine/threonine protein kinase